MLTFFEGGNSEELFEPSQERLLDLPAQFTVDELSAELLHLLLRSSECMAQLAIFAIRAESAEERNRVIEESVIFYWWYLEKLIDRREMVLEGVHHGFRAISGDLEAIRERVDHYENKSWLRRQQYDKILREAGDGARLVEGISPSLVENILCGGELCVSLFSVQLGVVDCIQTFARLTCQALSAPVK